MRVVVAGNRVVQAWRSWSGAWAATLLLLLAISVIVRAWDISVPCSKPCAAPAEHTLIFDEAFYVNAARVIAGIVPPPGQRYLGTPLHDDPNAEHPQLAKLIMAAGIKTLGDDPWGWRIGSIVFGTVALIGMFALVRAAGGTRWLAVGTTAVMACDNLVLVHSRIAMLDIYVLAMMLLAAVAYLRGRQLAAGILVGLAACMKLVGVLLLVSLVVLELMRLWQARTLLRPEWHSVRPAATRLAVTMVTTMVVLVAGVWVMDLLFPAYDPGPHRLYSGNPFAHIGHMISYGSHLTSRAGAPGISSSPWQWLLDQKPITYARAAVTTTSNLRVVSQRAILFFRGEINPFIILAAIPALFSAAGLLWRRRREPEGIAPGKGITTCTAAYDEVPLVAVAWFIGTFGPFVIQADVLHRVTYLFYILIVMPGIYLALAAFLARCGLAVIAGSAIVLAFGFVHQYPIRTFSGH